MVNLINTDIQLYSFDIFDTLITRKVAKPVGIFAIMQAVINKDEKYKDLPEDVKANFFDYRINSEYYKRRLKKTSNDSMDIKLEDIYNHLKYNFCLTDEQTENLKNLEIETELDNVVPIVENILKLKEIYNKGNRVILISDMYLPKDVIYKMLCNVDSIFRDIKIYISSEIGYMKSSGEVFQYIQKCENIDYKNWYHYGDNKNSDYLNAKLLGINAELFKNVQLKSYESKLLKKEDKNPLVFLEIGCAKNLRLNQFSNKKAQVGASLSGVIFYKYVSWIIDKAVQKGIDCLVFIARDGYILKKVADNILKFRNLNIKTQYMYGSKLAWRVPSLNDNKDLRKYFVRTLLWSFDKITTTCGLEPEELQEFIPQNLLNKKELTKEETINIYNLLIENNKFFELIIEKNKDARISTINYLKQEITPLLNNNIAFVDLDGSGYTQMCLTELLNSFCDKKFEVFYLASTPGAFNSPKTRLNYLYALKKSKLGHVLEIIDKAPHGQTIGYQLQNGKYEPILDSIDLTYFDKWEYDKYLCGILEYTQYFEKYYKSNKCIYYTDISTMDAYIKFITQTPSKEIADLFGDFIHSFSGKETKSFAPKIKIIDALKYVITGNLNTDSIAYSKARSSQFIKDIITWKQNKIKISNK